MRHLFALPPLRSFAWAVVLLTVVAGTVQAAELHFIRPDADAGTVRIGTALAHDFTFTITGTGRVDVVDLRASCGCLTPHLERRLYQAGDRGTIRLEVNTLTQPAGLQSWHLEIRYRSADTEREVALHLRARMVQEITVQPAALVLVADRPLTSTITVRDPRPQPLTVTDVRSSSPALAVAAHRGTAGSRETLIEVRIGPTCPAGRHEEIVSIYTDDPAYREMRVPVTINRRPRERVLARPHEVNLVAPPGQPVPSRLILLQDRDGQAVVVDSIHADDPAVSARWARGPGSMATVRIMVERGHVHGAVLKTQVHIRLKQPVPQEIVLPVSCQLQ